MFHLHTIPWTSCFINLSLNGKIQQPKPKAPPEVFDIHPIPTCHTHLFLGSYYLVDFGGQGVGFIWGNKQKTSL